MVSQLTNNLTSSRVVWSARAPSVSPAAGLSLFLNPVCDAKCCSINNNNLSNSLQLPISKRNRGVQVKYRWRVYCHPQTRDNKAEWYSRIHTAEWISDSSLYPQSFTQYKVGLSSNIDVHRMFFWVIRCGCQHILMSSGSQCDLRTYIILIQTEMMHTCECKHCLQRVHQNGSRLDSLTDVPHGPSGENALDPLTGVTRHITSRLKVISSFPLLKYIYDM